MKFLIKLRLYGALPVHYKGPNDGPGAMLHTRGTEDLVFLFEWDTAALEKTLHDNILEGGIATGPFEGTVAALNISRSDIQEIAFIKPPIKY